MTLAKETLVGRVEQRLADLNLSRGQLADAVGVTAGAVSLWLSGERTPGRDKVVQIAQALKTDVAWLEHGESSGAPEASTD